jgi:predicted alpha-1,6-mannanase (GH76 family)
MYRTMRKKRILAISCIVLSLVLISCSADVTKESTRNSEIDDKGTTMTEASTSEIKIRYDFEDFDEDKMATLADEWAENAQEALWSNFWDEDRQYLRREWPAQEEDRGLDYWWFAHAIDVLCDGYERTGDVKYLERAALVADGVYTRNGNSFINNFFDDMNWMALALMHYYDLTGEDFYLEQSQILFDEITSAWSGIAGGGIAWNRESLNFKNTPSNAPAVIIAVRLFERTNDSKYSDWAHKIFAYVQENLREADTGFIIDGIRSLKEDQILRYAYTYNHGTYIGAACEMYRLTGDETYLDYAGQTLANAFDQYTNSRAVIIEEGEGDGGLFKGILMRYVTQYYFTLPEPAEEVRQWICQNATFAEKRAVNDHGIIADRWMGPSKREQHLSSHLSGVKLMEACWRVNSSDYKENMNMNNFMKLERRAEKGS